MKTSRFLLWLAVASVIGFIAHPMLVFAARSAVSHLLNQHTYKPAAGYVPDEKTAIAVAVAAWNPIYGEEQIRKEVPYRATLILGVWHVEGSLKSSVPGMIMLGGVAEAEIAKDDGRILRISHGM